MRVLLVEDSENDAKLLLRALRAEGAEPIHRRVDSAVDLAQALQSEAWDIVITDHNLPGLDSGEALAMVRRSGLDIPVIIVSGSIGEDNAVAAMKSGANDYIMKDNLTRLAPAAEREIREAQARAAHRRAQETIRHLAYHDALTGLVNRAQFEARLTHALSSAEAGAKHALLYLDLDQFKIVNDTCGHVAGDELLRQVAELLKEPIRDKDTLARLGGDEFGLLLESCSLAHAQRVGERILQSLNEFRFAWEGRTFALGASIGLVMLEPPMHTVEDALRAADMACYAAKDGGRNRIQVYCANDSELRRRHGEMEWVARLQRALEENRFELHWQAIAALAPSNGALEYRELLLRMRGENGERIFPGDFIPAAERYNLMPALDRWVVDHAFSRLSEPPRGGLRAFFINISGATLSDEGFLAFVGDQAQLHRVNLQEVCFEITETAAIVNLKSALRFINAVKDMGCKVALDDFGAGLSSFSYLKTLPADYLKIDGSFIKDLPDDPMDVAIVEAINSVGHSAGLKTIAEFVESDATRELLTRMGIDYAQGYGIHRPAAFDDARAR